MPPSVYVFEDIYKHDLAGLQNWNLSKLLLQVLKFSTFDILARRNLRCWCPFDAKSASQSVAALNTKLRSEVALYGLTESAPATFFLNLDYICLYPGCDLMRGIFLMWSTYSCFCWIIFIPTWSRIYLHCEVISWIQLERVRNRLWLSALLQQKIPCGSLAPS